MPLHEQIAGRVMQWRLDDYRSEFPAISEILEFAREEGGTLRYLRSPQLAALETY